MKKEQTFPFIFERGFTNMLRFLSLADGHLDLEHQNWANITDDPVITILI